MEGTLHDLQKLSKFKKIALDTFISNDTYNQHDSLIIIGGTPRGKVSSDEFITHVLMSFHQHLLTHITGGVR